MACLNLQPDKGLLHSSHLSQAQATLFYDEVSGSVFSHHTEGHFQDQEQIFFILLPHVHITRSGDLQGGVSQMFAD